MKQVLATLAVAGPGKDDLDRLSVVAARVG
jgi:hypothetical protein